MSILRYKDDDILKLSLQNYIKKVLDKFNMSHAKVRETHMESHLRGSKKKFLKLDKKKTRKK